MTTVDAPVLPTTPRRDAPPRDRDALRTRDRVARAALYAALLVGLIIVVGPFLWMALSSVKPEAEIRQIPPTWLPETFTLDNYRELFSRLNFPKFFGNSLLVALLTTAGNLVFCSSLGYALAKLRFPGRKALFGLVLGMLMVPGMVPSCRSSCWSATWDWPTRTPGSCCRSWPARSASS